MFNPSRSTHALIVSFLLTFFCFALVTPGKAQDTTPPIILDDATPSIDAVITPANGAAGVVMLELDGVHVRLSTTNNVEVLSIADPRIEAFAFQYVSGVPPLVLRVERLPGVAVGRVKILPQSELPAVIAPTSDAPLTMLSIPVSGVTNVASTVALPIVASARANMFSAQVAAESTVQLADNAGVVLFTLQAGIGVQGIAARLAPGLYLANFISKDTNVKHDVTVALSGAPDLSLGPISNTGAQVNIGTSQPEPQATITVPRNPPQPPPPTAQSNDDHGGDDHGSDGHQGGDD